MRTRPCRAAAVSLALLALPLVAQAVRAPSTAPARAEGDPVVVAVGDIVCDPAAGGYDGSDPAVCQHRATAALVDPARVSAVLPLGDLQYEVGDARRFASAYDPTWGALRSLTRPAVGNHEYLDQGTAAGYFDYFGAAAGERGRGWYSYDLGAWHLVALNSNCDRVSCAAGGEQEAWLRADLAAHPARCTLAYFHHPRFSSYRPGWTALQPIWQALHDGGADVVLTGHDHTYERFAPLDASGAPSAGGVRPFVVGTGGKNVVSAGTPVAGSQVRRAEFGVLELALHASGYSWAFRTTAGTTPDSGSDSCDGVPPTTSPTATPSPSASASPGASPSASVPASPTPSPTPSPSPSATPPALLVRDERDPALRYAWSRVASTRAAGGSYLVEDGAGAVAHYAFRGTAVELLTASGPDMGRASLVVDGVVRASWDGWAPTARFGVVRRVAGLDPDRLHTATLRVSGTARAGARGTKVVLDGFRRNGGVTDATPSVDQQWRGQQAGGQGTRLVTSAVAGARVSMPFDGTAVSWTTAVGPGQGRAVVVVDGRRYEVDNWAPTTRYGVVRVWRDLPPGPHLLTVVVTGTARPGATGRTVAVDGFASR